MKKEMDSRESRRCLWRSQAPPQRGQKEHGARGGRGCPRSELDWPRMAGAGSAVFPAESPAPSAVRSQEGFLVKYQGTGFRLKAHPLDSSWALAGSYPRPEGHGEEWGHGNEPLKEMAPCVSERKFHIVYRVTERWGV